MINIIKDNKGAALISIIIVLPFLILIAFNYTNLATSNVVVARKDTFRVQAQMVADAGLDYGMQQITADPDWLGTGSEVIFDTTNNIKTTYQVVVNDVSSDQKQMVSTAKLYRPATSTQPQSTVKIATDLRKVTSGNFSVVTGVGGLYLYNSAKILGGNVFVNGEIRMTNTAQIGLSTAPVDVSVAHQICPNPANATYPQLCAPNQNGQPISISNSAKIYGDVKANNQTTTTGLLSPGLTSSSGVTPLPLPTHDRTAQKNAITTTTTGAAASCSSGTRTWLANTRINGDVNISNTCRVTVNGDVWITGKLNISNSAELIVSNTLGTTRPNIMVDGQETSFSNSSTLRSNSSGTGFQVINYWSKATCSPDCTDVTGTQLADSRDEQTIRLNNSSSGPNTIFYARWTQVSVNNSGQIGALIGQTVELTNSSTITFGTSTGIGTSYWILDGYRRSF